MCHGLAGNAELPLIAGSVLKDFSYKKKADDVGRNGIRRYDKNNNLSWPCGITTGETPSLMLGLAGIGYFYLRLYNYEKIPSVLILSL